MPSSRCSDLIRLLEERGAVFGAIEVKRLSESERMVIATEDAPKGETLMRIPMDLGLTPSGAVEKCGAAEDAILAADAIGTRDSDLLAIFLLARRARCSAYSGNIEDAYISSLPTQKELSHLPINWSDADAQWLKRTGVGAERILRRQREADFFRNLSLRSESFRGIVSSLDRWMWAKANVQSRGFSIPSPLFDTAPRGTCIGEQVDENAHHVHRDDNDMMSPKVAALFPLADMLNHRTHQEGCSCEFGVERGSGDFVIRTVSSVAAGSELTVSYGSLSASVSLLNYGFVQEAIAPGPQQQRKDDNFIFHGTIESDFVPMVLSLDQISRHSDLHESNETSNLSDLLAAKTNIWLRDEGNYPGFNWLPMERQVNLGIGTVEAAISVLSLLRVGVATMSELTEILESAEDKSDEFATTIARDPVCWRNERDAIRAFEGIVRLQAEGYTHPADMKNANQRSARKIIDREKSILKHWGLLTQTAGRALDESRESFDFGLSYSKLLRTLLATDQRLRKSKEV